MKRCRELLEKALIALKSTYDYNDYPGGANCSQFQVIKEIEEELAKSYSDIKPIGQVGGTGVVHWFDGFPKRGKYLFTQASQQKPLQFSDYVTYPDSLD